MDMFILACKMHKVYYIPQLSFLHSWLGVLPYIAIKVKPSRGATFKRTCSKSTHLKLGESIPEERNCFCSFTAKHKVPGSLKSSARRPTRPNRVDLSGGSSQSTPAFALASLCHGKERKGRREWANAALPCWTAHMRPWTHGKKPQATTSNGRTMKMC